MLLSVLYHFPANSSILNFVINEYFVDVRKSEQKYLLYSALLDAVVGAIIPVTPTIASVVTITVYTAAGNDLNASTVGILKEKFTEKLNSFSLALVYLLK